MTIKKGSVRLVPTRVPAAKQWNEYLHKSLEDPREAAAFLNAALDEGDPAVFLLALRHVAEARGISKLADRSNVNREHAYRILSKRGNPQLATLSAILDALDLRLAVEPKTASA